MSAALYIGDKAIALKKDFSIEFEFNNLVFTDDMEIGSFSIPIDLPIEGNEEVFDFVHLIQGSTLRTSEGWEDAKYYEDGNIKYLGKLIVLKAKNEKYIRTAFIINAMGLAIRDKKLNELDIEPIPLGGSDVEVMDACQLSAFEPKIYCFPNIKGYEFYDNSAPIAPSNVQINELVENWDNSNFDKPIVPFFFLTKLTALIIRSLGFTPSGTFFQDERLAKIAVSNMACLENENEETGFYAELSNYAFVPAWGNTAVFTTAHIYIAEEFTVRPITGTTGFFIDLNLRFASLLWEKITNRVKVQVNTTFGDTSFVGFDYEYDIHTYAYRARVKIYLSEEGIAPAANDVLVYDGYSGEISPYVPPSLQGLPYNPNSSDGIAHIKTPNFAPAAAQVGWFTRVEVYLEEKEKIMHREHIVGDLFVPVFKSESAWTAIDGSLRQSSSMQMSFDLAGSLLANSIDFKQLLPAVKVSEFFAAIAKDYAVQFTLNPGKKEIILDLCRDIITRPLSGAEVGAEEWKGTVRANPELVYDRAPKGYAFSQDFDSAESDPDIIEGYQFMGNYPNPAGFPERRHNNYIVNDEDNMIYLPELTTTVGVVNQPGWAGDYDWVKKTWYAPKTIIGDGSENIEARFLPLVYEAANKNTVVFHGTGKSRSILRSESSVGFFRSINYVHNREEINGNYVSVGPDSGPYDFSGKAYLLNYSSNQRHSLFVNLHSDWVRTLMTSRELEVEMIDGKMNEDLLDLRTPKTFDNKIFMIKKYRKSVDRSGWVKIKATLVQISP